ncbi:MAG: imidazole glycerol phosphate synthase subunit HisH [Candidatus Omnitrophica bacterium]|nr:imidazole glycerol phosphate synthase subunit HisH [Candidatus Omnitrophota bacterium]
MIAIIDYGMGNLRSVQKALEASGADAQITSDRSVIERAGKIVLPGVGAVRPAMARLDELHLSDLIRSQVSLGKPFLGICLGFQVLFDSSTEGGNVKALGILPGVVERFADTVKVPQMGWNAIRIVQPDCPMFRGIAEGAFVYFCHSYYARPKDRLVTATVTDYGISYTSSVCHKNIWGAQFHPEKSQTVGLGILRNFVQC